MAVREMRTEEAQARILDAVEECAGVLARLAVYATNSGATYRYNAISSSEKLVEFQAGTQSKSLRLTIESRRPQPKS